MFLEDPANSPRASTRHTPDQDVDSLDDLLAEPLHHARLAEPRMDRGAVVIGPQGIEYAPLSKLRVRDLVAEQIRSAGLDPRDGSSASPKETAPLHPADIAEIMTMLSCDDGNRTLAVRAICWLRVLGKESRSLHEIGLEYGVVRATVDAIYNAIKDLYERRGITLASRGDKDPSAREACRQRRLGKRKHRTAWKGTKSWLNPFLLPR